MPADRLFHPRLGHSQKVSSLSHLEARVWTQYVLSSDDFGVMRFSPLTIQDANAALARESTEVIQAALACIVAVELVFVFEHQGARFIYQRDWQDFQKVEYPRVTILPKPVVDDLRQCTGKTRGLFMKHPGGSPKHSPKVSRKSPEESPTTRAHVRAKRLTANGQRPTANGSGPTASGYSGEPEGERPFRPTPDEIKRGRKWREQVMRCPHDPPCATSEVCVGVQIRIWRAQLEGRAI